MIAGWIPITLLASVTPVGTAAGDITTYILGFGPLGVAVVLFALGFIVPKPVMERTVAASREDLIKENERLLAEKKEVEAQRDELQKLATDQLVPMLVSFTSATQSLLPLLQDLVRSGEATAHDHPGRGRG